jgi:hypothetical protein
VTRSLTQALLAIAATLALVGCVNLTQPLVLQQDADQGGTTAATGGSGGTTLASGGSRGGTAAGGTAGGTTVTGGAGGSVAPDAARDAPVPPDAAIDVPYVPDAIPPLDIGTGGSAAGASGSGSGGSGGTAGQTGSASGGQTSTGGTAVAGSGGSTGGGQAGSSGGSTGGASSSATGGAGATGGTTTATGGVTATCTPVPKSTGGLSCPSNLCTVQTYSGYDFPLVDPTGKSSICMAPNTLCAAGTVGAQDPPTFKVWGAGFGFSLSPLTTASSTVPVQIIGSGVTVTLSSLPTGGASARALVTVGADQYCAVMTKTSQTIPWTSFNLTCWAPTPAGALTGPPMASNFQIEASAGTTAGAFDFCLTGLSFQ